MKSKVGLVLLLLSLLVTLSEQRSKYAHNRHDYHIIPHAVDLDTITFDKIISKQNVTVVMFMHFLSYGLKQTEFAKFAESTVTQPEVVAATVGVIDEVELNNWELAERFNITMDQVPLIKLFVRGKEIATMTTTLNCENLRMFVTENTGMWVGRTGTVQHLDHLVERFLTTKRSEERERLIDLARQFRDKNGTKDEDVKSAMYYIRIFEEYQKQGPVFLGIEGGRLKAMMARHKLYKPSQCGLRKEQNILQTFEQNHAQLPHDEL